VIQDVDPGTASRNPSRYLFMEIEIRSRTPTGGRHATPQPLWDQRVFERRVVTVSTIDASRDHRAGDARATTRRSGRRVVERMLSYAFVRPSGSACRRAAITLGLVIGSALLVSSAAIHLQLWSMGYRTIPTIGPLFFVQAVTAVLLAVLLLVSRRLVIVVMSVGFMIATVVGLLLSVSFGLFGFMDSLAAPYAGLSLALESSGAVLLGAIGIVLASSAAAARALAPLPSLQRQRIPSAMLPGGAMIRPQSGHVTSVSITVNYTRVPVSPSTV